MVKTRNWPAEEPPGLWWPGCGEQIYCPDCFRDHILGPNLGHFTSSWLEMSWMGVGVTEAALQRVVPQGKWFKWSIYRTLLCSEPPTGFLPVLG